MKKKTYDEVSVVKALNRKRDVKVSQYDKKIEVTIGTTDCGNGTWGKIDYLVHYHGYVQLWVEPKGINVTKVDKVASAKATKRQKKESTASDAPRALGKKMKNFKLRTNA